MEILDGDTILYKLDVSNPKEITLEIFGRIFVKEKK